VLEPLADARFVPVARGPVEPLALHLLGEVVRAGEAVFAVGVVLVALAVPDVLHQPGGRVEDVRRRRERTGLLRAPDRLAEAAVDRDRFRRGREVDDGLRDRELAFGRAQPLVDVPCGERLLHGLRVGDPYVLVGEPCDAPRDEQRILAAVEHPREPVQGGVRVGAAHRLVEGRDEVVVALLGFVVQRRPLLDGLGQRGRVEGRGALGQFLQLLDHVQQVAAVPVGHGDERAARLVLERDGAHFLLGAGEERFECGGVEPVEDEHLAAGEERAVEFEAGVLGGGADEDDRAVFDVGQERVLLGAVEPVDLVDEQHGALADLAALPCGAEDFPQVGDPGERRGERLEREVRLLGEEARDRGLAAPGRAPQDRGDGFAARDHPPERRIGGEEVVLADDLGECARAQPVGEGPRRVLPEQRQCGRRIVHAATLTLGCDIRGERERMLRSEGGPACKRSAR
jgi:hypothetical protein